MSTSEGDISVIICTRDRPENLKACLQSLCMSKVQPLEVLVMDQSHNGSTKQVVEQIIANSSMNIRHVKLDSIGHTRSRNAGIEASRGDIVAFTDDDCTVAPDWLGTIAEEFGNKSVDCVCGGTRPANHSERPRHAWLSTLSPRRRRMVTGGVNPVMVGRGNNMAFRKSSLLKLGGFNELIGVGSHVYAADDLDLFYRLMDNSGVLVQSADAIVSHAQPDEFHQVLIKKRAYSISSAAVLAIRARQGDLVAGLLLLGKIGYEFFYLMGGGLVRLNRQRTAIGWHSFIGSLSGLKHLRNRELCDEIQRLSLIARKNCETEDIKALDTRPCEPRL